MPKTAKKPTKSTKSAKRFAPGLTQQQKMTVAAAAKRAKGKAAAKANATPVKSSILNGKMIVRDKTSKEIANALDVKTPFVRQQCMDGMPYTKGNDTTPSLFNLEEVEVWLSEHKSKKVNTLNQAREEEIRLKSKLRKIQIAEARKRLIPRDEVKQYIGRAVNTAKSQLMGLASALAPQLENRNAGYIEEKITKHVSEILEKLSRLSLAGRGSSRSVETTNEDEA